MKAMIKTFHQEFFGLDKNASLLIDPLHLAYFELKTLSLLFKHRRDQEDRYMLEAKCEYLRLFGEGMFEDREFKIGQKVTAAFTYHSEREFFKSHLQCFYYAVFCFSE